MSDSELRREAAGLFMVGFPGPAPDADVNALIDGGVAGVILFKNNITSAAQTAELLKALKTHAKRPLLAAVDQEGGRVARLRGAPFTALPTMRDIGRAGDEGLAERVGRLLAYEVRATGFDWDFAPVLDVDTNPKNPVIADRSFHSDAEQVARLGVALARGLEAQGVASSAKHFPGHGDTSQDSHHDLPRLPHSLERLRQVELVPFHAYAKAQLASVMTAHVVFEALDRERPATMSRAVLDGVLRKELGFTGVIVSDDLEMKAVAEHYPLERTVVEGLDAGVDLFLVCHKAALQRQAIDAVVRAVSSGRISRDRVRESLTRLERLTKRFCEWPTDGLAALGSEEHRRLATGLEATSFTGLDPTERGVTNGR